MLAIVIPAYKVTYLHETLESIAQQTDRRFRVYVGDDCSPYDVVSVVDKFRDRMDLTYVRFEENMGSRDLVAQWERCIDLTQGEEWIWLFSDDDVMSPDCVAAFYAVPEAVRRDALVHFDVDVVDSLNDGTVTQTTRYPSNLTAAEYLRGKLSGSLISYVVEFIFPRSLYNAVGGFEHFDLAWGSDFMTWLKMSARAKHGIVTPAGAVVGWRKSAENISPNASYPIIKRKLVSLIENAAFIKELFRDYPEAFGSLRYGFGMARFPLGEIMRNSRVLTFKDIRLLLGRYAGTVGFGGYAILAWPRILAAKYL
jgi:glycosyltransferase involved in cell wall biosynthesis